MYLGRQVGLLLNATTYMLEAKIVNLSHLMFVIRCNSDRVNVLYQARKCYSSSNINVVTCYRALLIPQCFNSFAMSVILCKLLVLRNGRSTARSRKILCVCLTDMSLCINSRSTFDEKAPQSTSWKSSKLDRNP